MRFLDEAAATDGSPRPATVYNPRAMRLVLFDIDGTLVRCGRQVRVLFAEALHEVFGTTGDIDRYDFGGKTDPQIVRELMVSAGVPAAAVATGLPAMRDAYLDRLEARLGAVEVLPGAREAVAAAQASPGVLAALLTGNWLRGARAKLARAGLDGLVYEAGAFGDDAEDRACLPPVAIARARELTGHPFTAADALIVGDSLEDVRCAHACGVPLVAVASGWVSAERLRAAGADRVVDSLDQALGWILPAEPALPAL
jgi:phosphoglycolate phosphatase